MTVIVSAFYKFVPVVDPAALRDALFAVLQANEARGTVLIAPEGINGTISARLSSMQILHEILRADLRFADLTTKDALAETHPFKRLKVKVKREIIAFRCNAADPFGHVGTYVAPQDWNALISDPEVLVLDTRNAYETAVGSFLGAVDPKTRCFGDLPAFVSANLDPSQHKRVAMFCTGGIRCEKASAYLLSQGFGEVYHLRGGILNYLAQVPRDESLFEGECFVFDERETVA